ncbi:hypothetical protein PRIPAC_79898 [Pristionchus pacificus]|uniref:Zinc finger protein n=1 Tax=Pristionchus pacificus TaxID=54126 RepID=A0A2A6BHB0_PRIPA|nr:hypothetical protein PRIPAC_79898 [Pristionchus pacificus]|eukprot:PDM65305.1 zinc finger protein [Pristionchus pacificus]
MNVLFIPSPSSRYFYIMCDLQRDPRDEIEYWRDKVAFALSREDKLRNVLTSSLQLMQSVIHSGPRAETLPLKIQAFSSECSTAMTDDPCKDDGTVVTAYRSLLYGMTRSVCALLNALNGAVEEHHREPQVKREAKHDQNESVDAILQKIRDSAYDSASFSMNVPHMNDSGINDQSMGARDQADDFPMDKNIESELSDVKVPLILKSNHSTPRKQKRAHPRHLLKSEDVIKKRGASVSDRRAKKSLNQEPNENACEEAEKKLQCRVCDKRFKKSTKLQIHMRSHTGEKPYKCDKCVRSYAHNYGLITHMLTAHSSLSYTCNICGDAFEKFGELTEHRKSTNHSGKFTEIFNLNKPFKCDQCGLAYMDKHELIKHQRNSHGAHPYTCNVCEDKPFKCDQCGLAYMDKYELMKHQRSSHGAHPYSCLFCGEAFEKHLELVAHKKVAHKNDAEVFDCNQCQRSYKENGELKRHLREAHGAKPYQCIVCGAAFAKFGMLGEHKKEAHK